MEIFEWKMVEIGEIEVEFGKENMNRIEKTYS